MYLKDYYKILELEPSASLSEIKKAYRRLALLYHPDKTKNDPYTAAQFTEIKEAYEVLSNPTRKGYYLQQRWFNRSAGLRKTQDIITPVTILKQVLELDKYVSKLDVFRMDKEGLFEYICTQLDDSVIEKLKGFNEKDINEQIIAITLKTSKVLPAAHVKIITQKLSVLADDNMASMQLINQTVYQQLKKEKWEKSLPFIILLITIIICLVIWIST